MSRGKKTSLAKAPASLESHGPAKGRLKSPSMAGSAAERTPSIGLSHKDAKTQRVQPQMNIHPPKQPATEDGEDGQICTDVVIWVSSVSISGQCHASPCPSAARCWRRRRNSRPAPKPTSANAPGSG